MKRWLAVAVCCMACEVGSATRDASTPDDAPSFDATSDIDAASFDASVDATVSIPDAGPTDGGFDAGTLDAGLDGGFGGCSFAGDPGTCLEVSACRAPYVPRAGLCPGPAEIQCCLPPHEVGDVTPEEVRAALGACTRIGGDYAKDSGGTENIPICQTGSVIWWDADFDVDCDGGRSAACMADPYYQPETSASTSTGQPLDASTLPFVVIPLASSRFRYADHGIALGQVALVLYGDRMVYGIFGDAGPSGAIGEGSHAMAEALGIPPSPISGGVDSGVTYLIFTGSGARVSRNEDHAEAVSRGEALLDAFLTP